MRCVAQKRYKILWVFISAKLISASGWKMQFLKDLLRNLAILIVIGIALLIFYPEMMKQVYELLGVLFGPMLILVVIAGAQPRRRRSRT